MATIHLNLHYSSHQLKPASPVKKKKNRHFNKLLRSFPAKRIFNKSVFPINMSSRWPQYFSVECNQMQLPDKWQKFTIWSNPREENGALLGYYAASRGNFLLRFGTTYRSHLQGSRTPPPKKNAKERAVLIYFTAEAWNHELPLRTQKIKINFLRSVSKKV